MSQKIHFCTVVFLVLISLILAAGCTSGTGPTTPTPTPTGTGSETPTATLTATTTSSPVTVSIAAKNIAFNTHSISVPRGAQVTVHFDNQDQGIQHNIAFYTSSAATQSIYVGQIVTGPMQATYTFTAPSTPGTYFFRCDVHPSQMFGDFIVT
ncbi:MAG: cupredoxin domain-containing protein [Methanomicrobiales archaeon]|nr:cupredoxin domain-containing protein [Methanomicrobiales archaeon]